LAEPIQFLKFSIASWSYGLLKGLIEKRQTLGVLSESYYPTITT